MTAIQSASTERKGLENIAALYLLIKVSLHTRNLEIEGFLIVLHRKPSSIFLWYFQCKYPVAQQKGNAEKATSGLYIA